MIERRYLQLDVFADRPGSGNPLGVVLDAGGLDRDAMQAFAAWANLSETIFFVPQTTTDADYCIRIFTPRRELPFAGHPSVGAAWAAIDTGLVPARATLMQECGAGLLPVRVEQRDGNRRIHVRSPRAHAVDTSGDFKAELATALAGMSLGALPPALWDNGPRWWLVHLASAAEVRTLRPNLVAIAELSRASGAVGLAVFGRALAPDGYDLAVRASVRPTTFPRIP